MATLFSLYPFLLKLYADGGYQGAGFQNALRTILKRVNVEIVKRCDQAQRFVGLPKRWLVERTFAWLGRCRRLAKDWECLNRKALASSSSVCTAEQRTNLILLGPVVLAYMEIAPSVLWFAAIQGIKRNQDLADLAPKDCFIAAEAVERVVG